MVTPRRSARSDCVIYSTGGWLQGIFTLDGLEQYAPNGSEYVYTIEEVTDYLNGYDTWAVDQNVTEEKIDDIIEMDQETSVTDLKPLVSCVDSGGEEEALTVSATFINQPSANPETQILTGRKVWDDAGDVFGKRPEEFKIDSEQPKQLDRYV